MIPLQLHNPEFRFAQFKKIYIRPDGKKDFEPHTWQDNPVPFDKITNTTAYATLGGYGGLAIIDADAKSPRYEELRAAMKQLPNTFKVGTQAGGEHTYYIVDGEISTRRFKQEAGELRAAGAFVFGVGSKVEGGGEYKIINDAPIAHVGAFYLMEILDSFVTETKNENGEVVKLPDESRSGREWAEVCYLIKRGLTDIEIRKRMTAFAKWNEAPEAYRIMTLEKARAHVKEQIELSAPIKTETDFSQYPDGAYRQLKTKKSFTAKELQNTEIPPEKYLVDGLIDTEGMDLIAGKPKDSKSLLTQHMIIHVVAGRMWHGKNVLENCRCLYIDEENGIRRLQKRQKKILVGMKATPKEIDKVGNNLAYSSLQGMKIDTPEGIKFIQELIAEHKPQLVVCDSIVRIMTGDENKATDVRKVFANIIEIQASHPQAIKFVCLHHVTKTFNTERLTPDNVRGSGDFGGQVNTMLIVNRIGEMVDGVQFFELAIGLSRDNNGTKGFKYKIRDIENNAGLVIESYGEAETMRKGKPKKIDECMAVIMRFKREHPFGEFKRENVEFGDEKFSTDVVTKALKELVDRGELKKARTVGYYE